MFRLRQAVKKALAKILSELLPAGLMRSPAFFHLWEKKGYHVTPVHFYQPVPDSRDLPPDIFEGESALSGVDLNEGGQLSLLDEFSAAYRDEYNGFSFEAPRDGVGYYFGNGAFETVDAEILYCTVRCFKPKRIIEIGSGYSTRVTAAAIRKNREEDPAYECDFVCVEPYPMDWIRKITEVTRVVESRVEKLPLDTFTALEENDILFIDSTHTINVYNDVCFEYLDVLPVLQRGVHVHIHDIVLPQRYFENWYQNKFFWNEQYLLQAFLAFNEAFRVTWAGQFMHLRHPEALEKAFPSYVRFKASTDHAQRLHGHKSFWLQRVR